MTRLPPPPRRPHAAASRQAATMMDKAAMSFIFISYLSQT
jgi:hypothetical protein